MTLDEAAYRGSVRIAAPQAVVFEYFTDPAKMTRWIGVTADLDARPGGRFAIDMNGRDFVRGEYVEIDPPNRIVFTWGWERGGAPIPAGGSTVEITLASDGAGTIVELLHRDLPEPLVQSHAQGWEHYLARLTVAAAGGDPGPDPWAADTEVSPTL